MEELMIKSSIQLNADKTKVWEGLTNPDFTKQYMYNCRVESDWKVGSPIIWKGDADGVVYVKGSIKSIKVPEYLEYTVIDPNSDIEDIPENYLTITYHLASKNGQTELKVTQGDYSKVANGEKRYADSNPEAGWEPILTKLKELVE